MSKLALSFDRSTLSTYEWNQLLKKAPRSNWMNTWPYAQAVQKRDYKRPQTILIRDQNNTVIGLFILFEIKIFFVHFVEIHRGPIWLEAALLKYGELELTLLFAQEFNKIYPSKWFTFRRWLPEVSDQTGIEEKIKQLGFKIKNEHYETVWLMLGQSLDDIKKQMHPKWRSSLKDAQTFKDLEVLFLDNAEDVYNFVWNYQNYKGRKVFVGLSPQFLLEEMNWALKLKSGLFLVVRKDKKMISGIYISLHGDTAAYRAGWNTDEGRKFKCHYLLLWQSFVTLKERGFKSLDLGGILPEQDSLNRFKLRTNGLKIKNMKTLT
ncbi:MAG: GNAT family N-acetyltransferase [Pseudobdellovibrio sp.]